MVVVVVRLPEMQDVFSILGEGNSSNSAGFLFADRFPAANYLQRFLPPLPLSWEFAMCGLPLLCVSAVDGGGDDVSTSGPDENNYILSLVQKAKVMH